MIGAKCSHDPGATIPTAPEEAVSRMELSEQKNVRKKPIFTNLKKKI